MSARNSAPNSLATWNEASGIGVPAGPPIAVGGAHGIRIAHRRHHGEHRLGRRVRRQRRGDQRVLRRDLHRRRPGVHRDRRRAGQPERQPAAGRPVHPPPRRRRDQHELRRPDAEPDLLDDRLRLQRPGLHGLDRGPGHAARGAGHRLGGVDRRPDRRPARAPGTSGSTATRSAPARPTPTRSSTGCSAARPTSPRAASRQPGRLPDHRQRLALRQRGRGAGQGLQGVPRGDALQPGLVARVPARRAGEQLDARRPAGRRDRRRGCSTRTGYWTWGSLPSGAGYDGVGFTCGPDDDPVDAQPVRSARRAARH